MLEGASGRGPDTPARSDLGRVFLHPSAGGPPTCAEIWAALASHLWVCGIAPGSCLIPGERWLPTLRERLEQRQNEVLVERAEQQKALDAQRQQLLKRWLELKAKEKADAEK